MIWLTYFISYFDRTNLSMAMPLLSKDLQLSPAQIGVVFSAFFIGYMVIMFPGGMIADKWGPKIVLISSLTLWSIFTGLTGAVSAFSVLIIVRVLFGVGEGLQVPAAYKVLAMSFSKDEQTKASSSYLTASLLGPILVVPLVVWLVQAFDWRMVFYISVIPGILVAILMIFLVPRDKKESKAAAVSASLEKSSEEPKVSLKPFVTNPSFWALFGMQFGISMVFWGLLSWLPTFLSEYRGINIQSSAVLAMTPYLGGFIGVFIGGRYGDKMAFARKKSVLSIAYVVAVACLIWSYVAADPIQVGVCLGVVGGVVYLQFAIYWGIVLNMSPDHLAGSISGLLNTAASLSGIVTPTIMGVVVGVTHSFAAGFGVMVVGLAMAFIGVRMLKPIAVKGGLEHAEPTPVPSNE